MTQLAGAELVISVTRIGDGSQRNRRVVNNQKLAEKETERLLAESPFLSLSS